MKSTEFIVEATLAGSNVSNVVKRYLGKSCVDLDDGNIYFSIKNPRLSTSSEALMNELDDIEQMGSIRIEVDEEGGMIHVAIYRNR